MTMRKNIASVLTVVLTFAGLGVLSGCDSAEIQAVMSGVEVTAGALQDIADGNSQDNNSSLTDWLLQQLN